MGILHPWPQMAITHRQVVLENCSNPLRTGQVVLLAIKKLFQFRMSGFVYVYMMAGCLSIPCLLHYDDVIIPWQATERADFLTQIFFLLF